MTARPSSVGSTYNSIAQLPVVIESYSLEPLSIAFRPHFTRYTTVIRLEGGGEVGVGEDVTPFEGAQLDFARGDPRLAVAGEWTIESLAEHLERTDLYRGTWLPPGFPSSFRRWALESAALDLALRQEGLSLAEALGRTPRPVTFVNSLGLENEGIELIDRRLEVDPGLRFKLDPAPDWTDELMQQLEATGAVDIVDLKGQYPPQAPIALAPEAGLYRRLAAALPNVWLEDPGLTPETAEVLEPHRDRITWDLLVRSPEDIPRLPIPPRAINIKPARHGTLRRLLDVYDYCQENGIETYGGGMGELGPGRAQIQYLASIFSADAPNDVAPVAYNEHELRPGLPTSPMTVMPAMSGFMLERR